MNSIGKRYPTPTWHHHGLSLFSFRAAELPGRLVYYWGHLIGNLKWGALAAAVVGFAALLFWGRPAARLLGFLFFGWAFYSVENDIPDIEVYFVPTYLVLALAAGFGLLLSEAEHLSIRGSPPRGWRRRRGPSTSSTRRT